MAGEDNPLILISLLSDRHLIKGEPHCCRHCTKCAEFVQCRLDFCTDTQDVANVKPLFGCINDVDALQLFSNPADYGCHKVLGRFGDDSLILRMATAFKHILHPFAMCAYPGPNIYISRTLLGLSL